MKRTRTYSGIVLLLLFVSYYGGTTLFRHSHRFGDNTIVHSHPHSGGSEHSHSAAECQFIQQLSGFLTLAAAVLSFIFGRFLSPARIFFFNRVFPPQAAFRHTVAARGPPAYQYC